MSRGKIGLDMAPRASSSISNSALAVNNSSEITPAVPFHTNQRSQSPQFTSNIHSLYKFGDELRCPLCKEFMRDPVLAKTCLHRFCSNCIHKKAAGGLTACPTCNILLLKKDPFRPDPNFAAIIEKLLPPQREIPQQNALETMMRDGVDIDFYKRPRSSLKHLLSNGYGSQRGSEQTTPVQDKSLSNTPAAGSSGLSQPPPAKISRNSMEESIKTSPPWCSSETPSTSHGVLNGHQNNHLGSQRNFLPILPKLSNSVTSTKEDFNGSTSTCPPTKPEEESLLPQPCTSTTESTQECNSSSPKMPQMRGFPPVMDLPNQMLLAQKQRLNREVYVELVLWPDSSIRRQAELPRCVRFPRYIYVPHRATVCHLIEYLMVRAEVEADWKDRRKYCVEITHVEDEPNKIGVNVDRSNNGIICSYPELSSEGRCQLVIQNIEHNYRIMLRTAHPFQPLRHDLTMAELANTYHTNYKKPLKAVYRFVTKNT